MDSGILCEFEDHVATVTLDRPRVGNRIDGRMAVELVDACETIEDRRARVVILRGKGKDFCLGTTEDVADDLSDRVRFVDAIARLTMPVVAVMEGVARGAGAALALAADLRVAAKGARIEFPEVGEGRFPGFGVTQRLPRLVGRARALEVLLFASPVPAEEALAMGLVTRVAPRRSLARVVQELLRDLCSRAPLALAFAKEAVGRSGDLPLAEGLRLEEDLYVLLQTTADRSEGVRGFLEKRRPRFRGC